MPTEIRRWDSDRTRLALVYLVTLPFTLPMFRMYFTGDDAGNVYYYVQRSHWQALYNNLFFWTSFRRPLAGLVYLVLYDVFGFTYPLPYYLTGFVVFSVNLSLLYWLFVRLTGNGFLAAIATAVASVHQEIADVWYNFGALYELLAFCGIMAGFHFYLSFLEAPAGPRRKRLYWATLAAYVLAINGKEVAVVFPALLLAYEVVYRIRWQTIGPMLRQVLARLVPFFAVAGVCTAGKTLGSEALWRDNPLYRYHFDGTLIENLRGYIEVAFLRNLSISAGHLTLVLAVALALALLLRSRHMVFGWLYFLIALLPVLGLPRVWGLFLYIPLVGLALYLTSLLFELGSLVGASFLSFFMPRWELRRQTAWLALAAMLVLLGVFHYGRFFEAVDKLFLAPAQERAIFAHQLFARFPELPDRAGLLILNSPLEDWTLHMTIWLHYAESGIHVFGGPNLNVKDFPEIARDLPEAHALDYRDRKLEELSMEELKAGVRLQGSGIRER
ncbi:MAG: hypothetical protein ACR2L2_10145 [Acidobacteriota bacterium]